MNLFLAVNPLIFYILAVVCFSAFVVMLLWFLLSQKKEGKKQTKAWTIESAKKFLASQNIDSISLNEKANDNVNTEPEIRSNSPSPKRQGVSNKPKVPTKSDIKK